MILSNTSIASALDAGLLVIDPRPPGPGSTDSAGRYNTTSIDLTLGEMLRIPARGLSLIIDPRAGDTAATLSTLYQPQPIDPVQGYRLDPGPDRLVLGATREYVALPRPPDVPDADPEQPALAARVEGKSTLARYGLLVHFTAPTIHANFAGTITLEIMNLGSAPITLYQDMPICQLIIEQVHGDPIQATSRFQGQTDPAGAI
ncbi:MAG: dCTP deaminase [Chloroflexi bacterium]|nr:dCTP deaminase [Chloroflexota bacterium]